VEKYLGPLPECADRLIERMQDVLGDELQDSVPNSLIVNEYNAGQGLNNHIRSTSLILTGPTPKV
jgi:hypothetical protein